MNLNSLRMARALAICFVAIALTFIAACGQTGSTTFTVAPDGTPKVVHHDNDDPYDGPAWFEDVTASAGIDFTYRNGEEAGHFAIIESLGGGIALLDYDKDGLIDIYLAGGGHYDGKTVLGHPGRLY